MPYEIRGINTPKLVLNYEEHAFMEIVKRDFNPVRGKFLPPNAPLHTRKGFQNFASEKEKEMLNNVPDYLQVNFTGERNKMLARVGVLPHARHSIEVDKYLCDFPYDASIKYNLETTRGQIPFGRKSDQLIQRAQLLTSIVLLDAKLPFSSKNIGHHLFTGSLKFEGGEYARFAICCNSVRKTVVSALGADQFSQDKILPDPAQLLFPIDKEESLECSDK